LTLYTLRSTNEEEFDSLYIEVNGIGTMTQDERDKINERRNEIVATMKTIFVTPWDMYLLSYKEHELALTQRRRPK